MTFRHKFVLYFDVWQTSVTLNVLFRNIGAHYTLRGIRLMTFSYITKLMIWSSPRTFHLSYDVMVQFI